RDPPHPRRAARSARLGRAPGWLVQQVRYMRLDFGWSNPLSPATRSEIEERANIAIRDNLEVVTREMPLDEAKALGAMALFGEKYGETVRVVDIGGPWS